VVTIEVKGPSQEIEMKVGQRGDTPRKVRPTHKKESKGNEKKRGKTQGEGSPAESVNLLHWKWLRPKTLRNCPVLLGTVAITTIRREGSNP